MALGSLKGWPVPKVGDFGQDASINGGIETGSSSTDPNLRNRNYTVIITQAQDIPKGPPRIVVGAIPQSLQIVQNVEWKAPFGAGLAGDGLLGNLAALSGNRLVGQVMTMQVWQGSGNDFDFTVEFELRAWSDPVRDVIEPLRTLLRMSLPSIDESGFLTSPGPILSKDGVKAISGEVTRVVSNIASAASNGYSSSDQKRTSDGNSVHVGSAAYDGAMAGFEALKKSGVAKKSLVEEHLKNKINIQIGRWFSMNNVVVTQVTHNIKAQTPERKTGLIQSATVTVGFKPMFSITSEDVETMLQTAGSVISLGG